VPGGVVHKLPGDLRKALIANATGLDAWKDITPLARNEFICWVEDAKQQRPENAAFAGPRRSWRKASVGPAAGQGASTANAPAHSSRVDALSPAPGRRDTAGCPPPGPIGIPALGLE
jgi:hypothetical protein